MIEKDYDIYFITSGCITFVIGIILLSFLSYTIGSFFCILSILLISFKYTKCKKKETKEERKARIQFSENGRKLRSKIVPNKKKKDKEELDYELCK